MASIWSYLELKSPLPGTTVGTCSSGILFDESNEVKPPLECRLKPNAVYGNPSHPEATTYVS